MILRSRDDSNCVQGAFVSRTYEQRLALCRKGNQMAAIVERKKRYAVVYYKHFKNEDSEDETRQVWETFQTMEDAERRKDQVEYLQRYGFEKMPEKTVLCHPRLDAFFSTCCRVAFMPGISNGFAI